MRHQITANTQPRRKTRWTQFSLIGLVIACGFGLFEVSSSAFSPAPTKSYPSPAISAVGSPALSAVAQLKGTGMARASVTVGGPSPRIAGSGVAEPPLAHQVQGPMPHQAHLSATYTTNWSGQVLSGGTFTGIGGTWIVPSVVPNASAESSATWLGIDGVTSTTLIQTGTTQETSGGSTDYFAWLEMYPNPPINLTNAPVSPGDQLRASIIETSVNVWNIAIEDTTANWIYSASYGFNTPATSAEWIEEAPEINDTQSMLANFASAPFTNLQIGGGTASVLNPYYMTNPAQTAIVAYPGAYDSGNDSFTDYYGTPPPVVTSVTPNQGTIDGGTLVTISGDFLQNPQVVNFGSSTSQFGGYNNGAVTALVPPGSPGPVDVTVTTAGGTSAISSADQFTYLLPAPPGTILTTTTTTPPTSQAATQNGYWLVGGDGGIFTFGSARFYGSTGNLQLQRPVVGITPTQSHSGYWLDASDGGFLFSVTPPSTDPFRVLSPPGLYAR